MTLPTPSGDSVLRIYLALAQYPILRTRIRERMRRELFDRGIISPKDFEAEVRQKAIESQAREGLHDPFAEESAEMWETRLARIRSHLTDFYFAYNLQYELFEEIVREVLAERIQKKREDILVSFNAELAPQEMLFEQAQAIERLPPKDYIRYEHRLHELIVVLIRRMISDQLAYINIAKEWFTVRDLMSIQQRKIGYGKIGGKAAGMLLAARILSEVADDEIKNALRIPESYFLGADVMYAFMAYNDLMHWAEQKYKTEEQIYADYPVIQQEYSRGEFPPDIEARLQELLEEVGPKPLIVRSSSLLEDNFGTSFAGKYESVFCPNQGTPEENLRTLTKAIARVYASGLNPDALLYRRSKGLQDYDERLAILLQVVEGERYGDYFFPHAAGVAFSRNLFRWRPEIRREDGFVRLVWGLGTRAVERVGQDYPRLVALSHPNLRPETSPKEVKRYSQRFIDVINLKTNQFETIPIGDVLSSDYPILRFIAQQDQGGYLMPIRSRLVHPEQAELVITFDGLIRRTSFAEKMRRILSLLEKHYRLPVDMEFALFIENPQSDNPEVQISLLQCRPQSRSEEIKAHFPENLAEEDIIFTTRRMVPQGFIERIDYVIYVPPEAYFSLPTSFARSEIGHAIGRLNKALEGKPFICVGPGRWGTTNPDLGVHVGYGDIYNTKALIELSGEGVGDAPDPSFGTHFFQDLVEANIYPLAVYLDDDDVVFNREFFDQTPNQLALVAPEEQPLEPYIRLIKVASYRPHHHIVLVMDDEEGKAVAFLQPNEQNYLSIQNSE